MGSEDNPTSSSHHGVDESILEHLNDLVSVVDKNYIYRAASKGYEPIFGKTVLEIIGCSASELHGQDVFNDFLKPALDKTLQGEEVEFQFSRPDGNGGVIHIHSRHSVYHGPLTDGPGVAVVARNVTDLVQANQTLEKERRLLKNIINTLPDFIFAKDSKGIYEVTNRSFEEFLNKSADEIIGKTDAELMSEASANYIQRIDNQVRETELPVRCEEWVTYADGRRRLLDMHKMPLRSNDEDPYGVLGIGTNVTFEREAEQNRQLASLFFEVTSNPCFILDNQGLILNSNKSAQKQFSAEQELCGPIFDHLFFTSEHQNDLNVLLSKSNYWQGDIFNHQDKNFIAEIHKVEGATGGSEQFIMILLDPDNHQSVTPDLLCKAYEDPLTALPNRRLFFSKLESAIIRAERQLKKLAILFIDLNQFKPINDLHGHSVGDKVLQTVAKTLSPCFRKTDTFARIGGDEFAALLDINSHDEAELVGQKIHQVMSQANLCEGLEGVEVSASLGISYFPEDGGTADELLHQADLAMYKAKRKQTPKTNSTI